MFIFNLISALTLSFTASFLGSVQEIDAKIDNSVNFLYQHIFVFLIGSIILACYLRTKTLDAGQSASPPTRIISLSGFVRKILHWRQRKKELNAFSEEFVRRFKIIETPCPQEGEILFSRIKVFPIQGKAVIWIAPKEKRRFPNLSTHLKTTSDSERSIMNQAFAQRFASANNPKEVSKKLKEIGLLTGVQFEFKFC